MRIAKTTSGATAVQVVWSSRRGSREIEHLGSAHDDAELEVLKAAAQQRVAAGQIELGLGLGSPGPSAPLPIHLLADEPPGGRRRARLPGAGVRGRGGRGRDLPARGAGPDHRVGEQAGLAADARGCKGDGGVLPHPKRRLPAYAEAEWRQRLSAACAVRARLGPASQVLYNVSTLYFETDQGDGFRKPGFSNCAEVPVMPRSA
jgi:hypothetical protein